MTEQRWPAYAALTGVAFFILTVLAFIIGGETPDTNDSPQKVLDFYKDDDSAQMFAAALLAWGAVFLLFFVGVLRSVLNAAEGGVARLSATALAGGVVLAIGMLSFAGFTFALADAADDLTPDAAQALNTLNSDFFFPVAAGLGTLMISTGLVAIRSRLFPAWFAWLTLLIGIIAVTPLGFFAFLAFGIWVLIASALLWRMLSTPTAAPTAAPPAAPTASPLP